MLASHSHPSLPLLRLRGSDLDEYVRSTTLSCFAASSSNGSPKPFDADARVLACAGGGDSRDQGSPLAPRRVSDKRHVGTMTIGPADTEARAQVSVRETTHRAGVGLSVRLTAQPECACKLGIIARH